MIELHGITIANNPKQPLAEGLSVDLAQGTLTALIGRNGCGKSTLLRAISGAQRPLKGTVSINGVDPARTPAAKLAQTVAVVTTESVRVRNLTCRELVAIGRSPHTGLLGRLSAHDEAAVDAALNAVGMSGFAGRQVTQMSDGETRRIMLARALAQDTPAILLDEPTSFLDVGGRYEICELLGRLAHEQQKTILYSTHELEPAMRYADNILLLSGRSGLLLPPADMRLAPEFKALLGGRTLSL